MKESQPSQKPSHQKRSQQALASLALRSSANEPRAAAPDLLEIERFRRGELAEPRRSEVLSHLARDPRTFDLLQQLEEADAELRRFGFRGFWWGGISSPIGRWWSHLPKRARLEDWIGAWQGRALLAGALGAVLLIAIIPLLPESDPFGQIDDLYGQVRVAQVPSPDAWPWASHPIGLGTKALGPLPGNRSPDRRGTRVEPSFGSRPVTASREQRAFRAGVRQALQRLVAKDPRWAATLARLPAEPPACRPDDKPCRTAVAAAAATGRWAVLVDWQCRAGSRPSEGFWQSQDRLRHSLVEALESKAPSLAVTLRDPPGDAVQARVCHGVQALLGDALASRR